MLECLVPENQTILDLRGYPVIDGIDSWLLGSPFARPPTEPIRLEWDPDTEGGKKNLYDATIPLMHKGLLDALQSGGIDNLDFYGVEIVHPITGEIEREYSAVNVLGAIQAADLAQSRFSDPSGRRRIDMDFDGLSISTAATRDLLLFRLAECVSGLVVHELIKRHLESMGGFGLSFVNPEDWIG